MNHDLHVYSSSIDKDRLWFWYRILLLRIPMLLHKQTTDACSNLEQHASTNEENVFFQKPQRVIEIWQCVTMCSYPSFTLKMFACILLDNLLGSLCFGYFITLVYKHKWEINYYKQLEATAFATKNDNNIQMHSILS